jgi:hypothetical protein
MSEPRRRLIRAAATAVPNNRQCQHRLSKLRAAQEKERQSLVRWMSRLRRAFHAVEKSQAYIARVERAIAKLEDNT